MVDICKQKITIIPGVPYGNETCLLNLDKVLGTCWTYGEWF